MSIGPTKGTKERDCFGKRCKATRLCQRYRKEFPDRALISRQTRLGAFDKTVQNVSKSRCFAVWVAKEIELNRLVGLRRRYLGIPKKDDIRGGNLNREATIRIPKICR